MTRGVKKTQNRTDHLLRKADNLTCYEQVRRGDRSEEGPSEVFELRVGRGPRPRIPLLRFEEGWPEAGVVSSSASQDTIPLPPPRSRRGFGPQRVHNFTLLSDAD